MSATMNGKPMAYEGRRNYAMLPAGPMRRREQRSLERLAPERVRVLMAGCYPAPKVPGRTVAAARRRAKRVASVVARHLSVTAAARRLRMPVKTVYNLLSYHGYDVARLTGKAAA